MKDSRRQRRMKCIMAWILMILMIFGDQTLINAAQSWIRSGADGTGAQQNAPMGIPEWSGSPMEMLGGHFTDPADMVDTDSVTTGKDLEEPDLDPEEIAPAGEISTGTEDGYAYSTDGSEVTITGYAGDETALMIPETISGMHVTEIKDKAFKEKTPLISVSFPRTLEKIGKNSFEGCTSLSSVTLSENVIQIDDNAFKDCSSLSELNLPESLQEIGSSFIAGTGIKSITIPKNVKETNISASPLNGAKELTEVIFAEGMTVIPKHFCQWSTAGSESAIQKVTIPESVTEIGLDAFENCRNLPQITLPSNLKKIDDNAFRYCYSVSELDLPESLQEIGSSFIAGTGIKSITIPKNVKETNTSKSPLSGAEYLTDVTFAEGMTRIPKHFCQWSTGGSESAIRKVTIPESVTEIGLDAFENCRNLPQITLPSNLKKIDNNAFKDCRSLNELDLPESLQEIGSSIIAGTGIKSITIPQNVKETNTSEYPLSGAVYLTDVTFAEGMTRIPKHFCHWNTTVSESAIRKVTIPESVTEIGTYAFQNCRNLAEVDLRKVRKLGNEAFKGCVRLRHLYFREAVDEVGNNVFSDCPNLVLHLSVPCRLLEVAIANNIPLEMDKLSHRLIDPDQSYYTLNSASNTGDLDHVIKYEIAKPYRGALSSKVISIALPPNLTFKENSVTVDNRKADYAYESKNHALRIPVSRDSGLIHFMAKPDTVSRVTSAVFLECEEGGETDREMIGLLDTEMPIITLRCDTTVSKAVFPVRGETMGQSTVRFTIDGAEAGVTSANKAGQYSTSLTLPSPAEGKTYAVTAYVQKEDETLSQNVMVNYNTQKPVVQEFKLIYYQHSTKALEYDLLNNSTGIGTLVYNPGYGYTFKVRFSLPEKIHSLYVTSTRNGKTAKLEAVWNPDLEAFVTHGRFNNDRNYVPGDLGLAVNTTIPKTKPQTPLEREETTKEEVSEIISQLTDEQKEDFKNNTEIRVNNEKTFEADQTLDTGDVVSYRVDRYTSDPEVYKDLVERKEIEEDTGYLNIHRTLSGRYPSYASHDGIKKTYLVRYTNRSYVTLSYDYNTRAWFREEIQSKCERDLGEIFADNIKGALEGDLKNLIFKDFAPVLDAAGTTFDWLNDRAELMAAHQNAIGMTRQEIELALVMTDTFYVSRMALIGAGVILGVVFPEGAVIIAVAGFAAGIILDILEDLAYENFDKLFAIYLKWIIDPSGYVYSAVTDHKLPGITAIVYYKDTGTGEAVSWNAAEYEQLNPQLTTEDGVYFWNVPEGLWRVGFSSGDYEPRETDWMEVPPPQTDIAVELAPSFAPALVSANAFEDRVSLTFNQYMKPEGFKSLVLETASGETVPYSVEYDRTKTAQDGTVYADECLLRFEERLEGGTRLRLSGSTPLESAYGKKLSLEPFEMTCLCSVKINASEKPEIKAGSTEKIPIRISAGAEYAGRLTVEAQNPSILTAEDRIVEEEGRYYLKVTGCMYGDSEVYVRDGNVTVLALHVRVDDETHFGSLVYQISFCGGDDTTGIPPETLMEEEGTVIILPDNPFMAEGKQFLGWSDGNVTLKPGDPYTVKAEDVRFVAIWKTSGSDEEPVKPVDPHDGGEGVEEGDLPDGRTAPKGIWIGGLKKSYPYTGSAIKPVFRVYYGEKRLAAGEDYTVGYRDNKNVGTNAKITVKLKGDFSGSETVNFEIVKNDLSSSGVTAEPLVAAYKKGKKNDNVRPVLTLNGIRLKYGKNDLTFTYQGASSNEAGGCTEVGDYIVKVAAAGSSAGYAGFIDVPLTVTDKPVMSAVKITADRKAMAYTGEKQMPSFTLKYKGQPLAEGTYAMKTVSGDDYTEPGNHTVIFEGNNKDVFGRKAVTFRITGKRKLGDSFAQVEILSADLIDGKVPFAAGGAKPSVKASYKGEILKAGRDYTVSYRGNKKAGSSAAAIVKGKGRYGGSKTVHFTVGERDLKTLLLLVSDRPVSAKNKDYEKTGILFTDKDFRNQKLKAGRDYTAEFTVSSGSLTPGAGETVSVKITARPGGNYTGVTEASFSIIEKEKDLSRARVVVNSGKPYAYTGKAITPSGNEVAVMLNGQQVGNDQYEISAFNNVAKGNNAVLVIRGRGGLKGYKAVKFKIRSADAAKDPGFWDGVINMILPSAWIQGTAGACPLAENG